MTQQDPNIGRDILDGQFQILQKIGSGGMGSVYKAAQPAMNRMVAVKILHPKLTNRKDLVSRFRREARAMSHLEHPNTVKVLLFGELDDGSLYIVMEYLEGKNLNQVVRKEGPLVPERAVPILIQVCGALQEAHLQGIIHRDLKPENIFLSTNGGLRDYPKVLDFGLAKVTERELRPGSIMLTQEGMVFGTPEFMSPEQAQGKVLDARSDIYSLATILYEVLTGKLPFDAKTPMDYIQAHVTKPPIALDDRIPGKKFPSGLGAAVLRALEKAPEKRYGSAAEFAQALKPYAGMAGKGFTAMMPRGTAQQLAQVHEIPAASQELPVVPIEPSKPSVPIRGPSSMPKTVRMSTPLPGVDAPPAPPLPATTPEGKVPIEALAAAAALAARKSRTQPSALMLMGIAVGCLLAGVLITVLILKIVSSL
jgi:eukaryotic-like serine/threonine-protein kinase